MKVELLFHLDDVGMSESEDRKKKKVIIPTFIDSQTIYHKVSKAVRHISIITCIIAAGESLTPDIVTSQDSETVRKRLMSRGVRLIVDFVLKNRLKPYVSRELFLHYIKTIFVPYLTELRDSEELEGCEAVLLMDNYSLHIADDIISVLTSVRVRVITFTPHTTHVFEIVDVVLFGALKKHATGLETLHKEEPAAAFLLKVCHDFKQTMIEVNIWGAFSPIWFSCDIAQNPYGLLFDEEKLRQSRGFVELWERDTPLENLLKRRREGKFGWITSQNKSI
jgi:hypothetical protein